jgi:anaerobic ribonucleoside-triphosphate reductase
MCSICRKFKKGSLTIDEAREELEEQADYLSEEHIEEIEEMLFIAEDTYDYIQERKKQLGEDEDLDYEDYEERYMEDDGLPDDSDNYDMEDEDE